MSEVLALFDAERRRFFSRRVVHAMFAFGIGMATLVLVILTVRSGFRTGHEGGSAVVCTTTPGNSAPVTIEPGNGELPPGCTFQNQFGEVRRDHRLKIGKNYSDTINGTGATAVFVAFVIGASFIGAEYGASSLSTQLIFEPRRTRVIAVKAAAVGFGTAVLTIVLLLYIGLLQWGGSQLRGVVSGLDASWFASRAGDIGRVAAAVGLAAMATYAITVVTRRTVAAVAAMLVTGWVSAIVGNLAAWRWVSKYNPASSLLAMAVAPHVAVQDRARTFTAGGAAVASCIWVAGLLVVAAFVFGRREVR